MEAISGRPLWVLLVHGTWGRGFQTLFGYKGKPSADWCKEDSPFYKDLNRHLSEIGFKPEIDSLPWSGSNSFSGRADATKILVNEVVSQSKGRDILFIAHSHGGNILMSALNMMRSLTDISSSKFAVTVATPFVKVGHFDLRKSHRTLLWFAAVGSAALALIFLASLLIGLENYGILNSNGWPIFAILPIFLIPIIAGAWAFFKFNRIRFREMFGLAVPSREAEIAPILESSCYSEVDDVADLLVIRGLHDEASMVLMLGAIASRIFDILAILVLFAFGFAGIWVIVPAVAGTVGADGFADSWMRVFVYITFATSLAAFATVFVMAIFKSAFGKEILTRAFHLDVSATTVPDVRSRVRVTTLSREPQGDALLLHGLYNHPDCVRTITDWLAARVAEREAQAISPASGSDGVALTAQVT